VIAEIETDKATMEVEAVDEGRLQKILVQEGTDGVPVNAPIAVLLGEGEDPSAAPPPAPKPAAPAKPSAPAAAPIAAEPSAAAPARPAQAAASAAPAAPPAPARPAKGDRLFASPLARRMAADAGLDLKAISGSGPHGRIVKADVETAKSRGPSPQPAAVPAAAKVAAPAAAAALRKVPAANAAWSEEGIVMFDAVDISVAVAIPGGLITPIIRNADSKGLAATSTEMKSLAAKAREGKLKLEEFQGGTFS